METAAEGQRLTAEDQLFLLLQAGRLLTFTRGYAAPEARLCYERAEPLCEALNRPALLYLALLGRRVHSLVTDRLTATMQIAQRLYTLALEQNDAVLLTEAYGALADTLFWMGEFEAAQWHARRGVELWRSGAVSAPADSSPALAVVACLCQGALCEWHLGGVVSSQAAMAEAIAAAKAWKDPYALAAALHFAAILGYLRRDPAEVERLASDLIELSTRHHSPFWLAVGEGLHGRARSLSGETAERPGQDRALNSMDAGEGLDTRPAAIPHHKGRNLAPCESYLRSPSCHSGSRSRGRKL